MSIFVFALVITILLPMILRKCNVDNKQKNIFVYNIWNTDYYIRVTRCECRHR